MMERESKSVSGLPLNEALRELDGGVYAAVSASWTPACVCMQYRSLCVWRKHGE